MMRAFWRILLLILYPNLCVLTLLKAKCLMLLDYKKWTERVYLLAHFLWLWSFYIAMQNSHVIGWIWLFLARFIRWNCTVHTVRSIFPKRKIADDYDFLYKKARRNGLYLLWKSWNGHLFHQGPGRLLAGNFTVILNYTINKRSWGIQFLNSFMFMQAVHLILKLFFLFRRFLLCSTLLWKNVMRLK